MSSFFLDTYSYLAALAPLHLGVKFVIAKSFARIQVADGPPGGGGGRVEAPVARSRVRSASNTRPGQTSVLNDSASVDQESGIEQAIEERIFRGIQHSG